MKSIAIDSGRQDKQLKPGKKARDDRYRPSLRLTTHQRSAAASVSFAAF